MSKQWFICQTYSGYENSVKADIERRIESMNMQNLIHTVLVPEEQYEEQKKDGSKKIKTRKIFPGYIFIEIEVEPGKEMDDEVWFMIRNTQKVTGFLGSSGGGTKPTPVREDEMNGILRKIGLIETPVFDFKVGDNVLIVTGPWKDNVVEISSINEEKDIVTVLVEMFGRRTPTELSLQDIKKI